MSQAPALIDSRVNAMIREFAAAQEFAGMPDHRCIYRSVDYPDTRQVWRVALGPDIFALKLDYDAEADGRLAKEFQELLNLRDHFARYDKLGIATPVYLSPTGAFCVTEFLDHKTAGERPKDVENEQTRRQVHRRAGLWLHAMHEYHPLKKNEFWGNWMVQELDALLEAGEMQANPTEVKLRRALLREQVKSVNRMRDLHATSHGDYHSENMMLGPGMTYGFDFTEARRKMAVYDIVDFLKVDIYRDTPRDGVDSAGITATHREMFFKGYKHPINHDILDVAIRGRLLIDYAAITRKGHAAHGVQQSAFRRLKLRLDMAFGDV